MSVTWGSVWNRRPVLAVGGFALLVVSAMMVQTSLRSRGSAPTIVPMEERARQAAPLRASTPPMISSESQLAVVDKAPSGTVGGVPGGVSGRVMGDTVNVTSGPVDRKIVRTGSMELTVSSPADAVEKIRTYAEGLGGYVESAQVNSSQNAPSASITIRVPAARFEDAKSHLRTLAAHIDNERMDAQDVTKEYVDLEARIHNLRAEEAQYLVIMKSATKVEDMLDVSEHLSQVRGEIEQAQAEFQTLSKQTEMVAISISLRVPLPPESFALSWQPMRRIRMAWHDTLEGLADYGLNMVATILYLPVLLLWVGTILVGIILAWRTVQWTGRKFFAWPKTEVPSQPAV